MAKKVVVIGGGIAGAIAALTAREKDKEAEITILGDENYPPYRRASLLDLLSGVASDVKDIFMFPESFYAENNINLKVNAKVSEIKPDKKIVKIKDNSSGGESELSYDSLIIATGAAPFIPKVPGTDKAGVFSLWTIGDVIMLSNYLQKGKSAVVEGAGFIGLKTVEALLRRGIKVTLVVRSRILRALLEKDFSLFLHKKIEKSGVKIVTGASIEEICGKNSVEYVIAGGEKIKADLVVFATGVRPCVDLAKKAGLNLGPNGAIDVNNRMETSMQDIYACGNCAETLDYITKKKIFVPIGSIAASQAKIAGANAVGEEIEVEGFFRAQMEEIFDLEIISIGHGSESARDLGFNVKIAEAKVAEAKVSPFAMATYKPLHIKVIAQSNTGQIYGAQVIGERYTMRHGSLMLSLIANRAILDELSNFKYEILST